MDPAAGALARGTTAADPRGAGSAGSEAAAAAPAQQRWATWIHCVGGGGTTRMAGGGARRMANGGGRAAAPGEAPARVQERLGMVRGEGKEEGRGEEEGGESWPPSPSACMAGTHSVVFLVAGLAMVCAVHVLVLFRALNWCCRAQPSSRVGEHAAEECGGGGLSAEQVCELPCHECAVCLEAFRVGDRRRVLPGLRARVPRGVRRLVAAQEPPVPRLPGQGGGDGRAWQERWGGAGNHRRGNDRYREIARKQLPSHGHGKG